MGKVEVIQIPKELHPSGEGVLKIMHGPEEPPKNYIWEKGGDDYYIWNGKKWIPYEFELIKNKGCIQKNCCCVTNEQMAVKFDKFKKDVLAAVLKMNQTQDATNIADIRAQLAELNVIIHQLEEFENYYTKEEIDNKTSALTNLTTALNNSVNGLSRRLAGLETNFADTLPTIARLDAIDHTQFITARDVSDLDPSDYPIDVLDGYATQDYVDRAVARLVGTAPTTLDTLKEISDALGSDANFAVTVTNALANKVDRSEIPEQYDDSALIARIQTLENKPFDQYLTDEESIVISTSLNDLNSRVSTLENEQIVTQTP